MGADAAGAAGAARLSVDRVTTREEVKRVAEALVCTGHLPALRESIIRQGDVGWQRFVQRWPRAIAEIVRVGRLQLALSQASGDTQPFTPESPAATAAEVPSALAYHEEQGMSDSPDDPAPRPWRALRRPATRYSVLSILGVGFVIGILFWGATASTT